MKRFFLSFVGTSILVLCVWLLAGVVFGGEPNPPAPIPWKIERVDLAKTQTYEMGGFVYMYVAPYIYTGPRGYLFPNGEFAYIGKSLNQMFSTPWGIMYWHGTPKQNTEPVGWLPYPNIRAALPPPKPVKLPPFIYH